MVLHSPVHHLLLADLSIYNTSSCPHCITLFTKDISNLFVCWALEIFIKRVVTCLMSTMLNYWIMIIRRSIHDNRCLCSDIMMFQNTQSIWVLLYYCRKLSAPAMIFLDIVVTAKYCQYVSIMIKGSMGLPSRQPLLLCLKPLDSTPLGSDCWIRKSIRSG